MKVLRANDVVDRVGYSLSHLKRLEQAGDFPQRLKLGARAIAWVESEVDDWLKARAAQRDDD